MFQRSFPDRESTSTPQWGLAFTRLSVHTEPSSVGIKSLQCVISYSIPAMWNHKRHDGTHHNVEICVVLAACFLHFPPVNLNMYPATVYKHMDIVIRLLQMHDPSGVQQDFWPVERSIASYNRQQHKRTLSGSNSRGGTLLFYHGKFTEVLAGRADHQGDLSSYKSARESNYNNTSAKRH